MARRGPGAALALAGAAALVALAVALVVAGGRATPRRVATLRPVASHRGPALDGAHALRVYAEVDRRARALSQDDRAHVARTVLEEASRAGLSPGLVLAVIHVESSFRHRAASRAGALGLMQLRPPTMQAELARARMRGADPLDPAANVRAGVRYLGRLVRAFDDLELALVAYNAGPARLRRHLASGHVPERLLRYAQLVQRVAARHAIASHGAVAPASGIALSLAPSHAPRRQVPASSPPPRGHPRDPGPPRDAVARAPFRQRPNARRGPGRARRTSRSGPAAGVARHERRRDLRVRRLRAPPRRARARS